MPHTGDLITLPAIENLTRREFLFSAFGAALLVACGDDDDSEPTSETRRVDTPLGPVDVPLRPERVVVFDRRGTLAYLTDLGVTPVGAMSAPAIYGSKFHPLLTDVDAVETLDWQDPDLEKVATMNPDLIVGFRSDVEPVYEQLTGIAPTVALAIDLSNPHEQLTELGHILGMEDKAAELLQGFEAEVEAAKERVTQTGTVSLILPLQDGIRIYRGVDFAGQVIQALGMTMTPDIDELGASAGDDIVVVSFEQASVLDGDTLVVFANLSSEQNVIKQNLYDMPVFQTVPAVRNGRVVEVESQANFGTAGLKGQRQILEALTEAFA